MQLNQNRLQRCRLIKRESSYKNYSRFTEFLFYTKHHSHIIGQNFDAESLMHKKHCPVQILLDNLFWGLNDV